MSLSTDFDLKERVRGALDILDVVGQGAEVRPQGRNFVIRCPFHNDRRPSLTINPERQSWKCWVCDVGGDIFSFVMQRDGVDFPTALRVLAEQAGIPFEEGFRGKKTKPGDPDDRSTLLDAVKLVVDAYARQLDQPSTEDAKLAAAYLRQRGIDDESRRRFRIGFAPDEWSFATDLLSKNSFSGAVAKAAGLALQKRSGDGYVDYFRGRLMFPIVDLQDRPIAIGGRQIPEIASRHGEHAGGKYVNSPETPLFQKSRQLYGLQLAREAVRKGGEVLVMEGYTDVVLTRQAGIEHSVAVLGTALTEHHVKVLKRFAKRVVLVLDGDQAGQNRADQVLELFVRDAVDLRVLTLPENSDPADFVAEHGRDEFLQLVSEAPDALDHKLSRMTAGIDLRKDTHAATMAIEAVLSVMAKSPSADLRQEQMLVRLADTSGIAHDRLSRRLDALRRQPSTDRRRSTASRRSVRENSPLASRGVDPNRLLDGSAAGVDIGTGDAGESFRSRPIGAGTRPQPISGIDRELFELLIECPDFAAMAVEAIDPQWLAGNAAQMLLSAYQDLDLAGKSLDVDTLLLVVDNEHLKNQIVTLQQRVETRRELGDHDPTQRYAAIVTRYREREFELEKSRQIERLASATLADDEELELLRELWEAEGFRQGISASRGDIADDQESTVERR